MGREVDKGSLPATVERVTDFVRSAIAPMTPAQRESGLDIVRARLAARQRQRVRLFRLSFAGTGAGVVACAIWLVFSGARVAVPQTSSLAYHVEGGEIVDGGYLRSLGSAGVKLRFTEGSELEFIAAVYARSTPRAPVSPSSGELHRSRWRTDRARTGWSTQDPS
jgi:hypothetical protein